LTRIQEGKRPDDCKRTGRKSQAATAAGKKKKTKKRKPKEGNTEKRHHSRPRERKVLLVDRGQGEEEGGKQRCVCHGEKEGKGKRIRSVSPSLLKGKKGSVRLLFCRAGQGASGGKRKREGRKKRKAQDRTVPISLAKEGKKKKG